MNSINKKENIQNDTDNLDKIIFENLKDEGFTIYTKSGCKFCTEVKKLLKKYNMTFHTINCDDYLLYTKENFLFFIKTLTDIEYKTFPMVFYNKKFIGGYVETKKLMELTHLFDSEF